MIVTRGQKDKKGRVRGEPHPAETSKEPCLKSAGMMLMASAETKCKLIRTRLACSIPPVTPYHLISIHESLLGVESRRIIVSAPFDIRLAGPQYLTAFNIVVCLRREIHIAVNSTSSFEPSSVQLQPVERAEQILISANSIARGIMSTHDLRMSGE